MKARDAHNVLNHVHPDTDVAVSSLTSPDGSQTVTFEEALANIMAGRMIWDKARPQGAVHRPEAGGEIHEGRPTPAAGGGLVGGGRPSKK